MQHLKQIQEISGSIDEIWDFFSSPRNLNHLVPREMVFEITSEIPEKMYEGMFITYKFTPLLGIPLIWATEITKIEKNRYFIDEQRKGPYKFWHHEHHFETSKNGVVMTDLLYYDVGKLFLGQIAESLFVKRKVEEIFKYRTKRITEIFSDAS